MSNQAGRQAGRGRLLDRTIAVGEAPNGRPGGSAPRPERSGRAARGVLGAAMFLAALVAVAALAWRQWRPGPGPGLGRLLPRMPTKRVPALYEPPKGRTILVFVDDVIEPVAYRPIKPELTERLNRELTAHGIAAGVVPHERLAELRATTPDFDRLAVSQVGQKAGADLVLYVRLDELTLPDAAAATPPGEARLRTNVRMVDVTKGRLWPRDRPDGHPVGPVELPAATAGGTGTAELAASLAGRMADRIARLFYVHDVPAASRPSG